MDILNLWYRLYDQICEKVYTLWGQFFSANVEPKIVLEPTKAQLTLQNTRSAMFVVSKCLFMQCVHSFMQCVLTVCPLFTWCPLFTGCPILIQYPLFVGCPLLTGCPHFIGCPHFTGCSFLAFFTWCAPFTLQGLLHLVCCMFSPQFLLFPGCVLSGIFHSSQCMRALYTGIILHIGYEAGD